MKKVKGAGLFFGTVLLLTGSIVLTLEADELLNDQSQVVINTLKGRKGKVSAANIDRSENDLAQWSLNQIL